MGKRRGRWKPVVKIQIYAEGGGNNPGNRAFREALGKFVENAGLQNKKRTITACGSRDQAYKRFKNHNARSTLPVLLVDSEGPVTAPASEAKPWDHLKDRPYDKWERPSGASDDQCHLMVEAMESWFLADRDALKSFYGQGFQESALPDNPSIEEIHKQDIFSKLNQASRNTHKGKYNKGKHSFAILKKIDPAKVIQASPYAKRFVETLLRLTS